MLIDEIPQLRVIDSLNTQYPAYKATVRSIGVKRALWQLARSGLLRASLLKLGWLISAGVSGRVLLPAIISYLQTPSDYEIWYGVLLALGFFVSEVFRSLFVNQHWFSASITGVRLRGVARLQIYEKALLCRDAQLATAQASNLMATDAERILLACQYAVFLLSAPVTSLVVIVLMWTLIGPATLAGFVTLALLTPLGALASKKVGAARRRTVKVADTRIRTMQELLSGIRLVKLCSWEPVFEKRLTQARSSEIRYLSHAALLHAGATVISTATPLLVTLAAFAAHVLATGEGLTAAQAFSTLAMFNTARFPLSVLAVAVRNGVEGKVALNRLAVFMAAEEVDPRDHPSRLPTPQAEGEVVVELRGASYAWTAGEAHVDDKQPPHTVDAMNVAVLTGHVPRPLVLRGLNLEARAGQLVAVVGDVGAGKTALLKALLGRLHKHAGSAACVAPIAYVAQSPWVFNASLRENIVFPPDAGLSSSARHDAAAADEGWYQTVLQACALEADLQTLPAGDATEIGEKGLNLSGGQRARVGLARAVLSKPPLVLADDVLAAVDVHVAKQLWRQVLGPSGLLRHATRIIVTHATHLLPDFDHVVVLQGGQIAAQGTPEQVRAALPNLDALMHTAGSDTSEAESEANEEEGEALDTPATVSTANATAAPQVQGASETGAAPTADVAKQADAVEVAAPAVPSGTLYAKEQVKKGAVGWATFVRYARAAGSMSYLAIVPLALVAAQAGRIAADLYLTDWVGDNQAAPAGDYSAAWQRERLGLYAAWIAGVVGLNLLVGAIFALATLRASKSLHNNALIALLRGSLAWFESVPMGQILQRFAADLDAVDTLLPSILQTCLDILVQTILICVFLGALLPWILLPLAVVIALFVRATIIFRRSSRQLKRLENVARTPMFNLMTSSGHGLDSLAAYGRGAQCMQAMQACTDRHGAIWWAWYVSNRWLSGRIDFCVQLIVTGVALLAVLVPGMVSPAQAALALVYCLNMGGTLQYGVRLTSQAESYFTSVERLIAFEEDTPREPVYAPRSAKAATAEGQHLAERPWATQDATQAINWPSQGALEFRNMDVRYREGLDLALRGLTLHVPAGAKLGVVGRTGSGKSTTALSLFRVIEAARGSITIDGVNIGEVNVYELRRALAIIPQDPTLFVGDVRGNLTAGAPRMPTDAACWEALDSVGMCGAVKQAGGLEATVGAAGAGWSAGQRQLLCIARAMLRGSRVVVMDEPSASISEEADAVLQRAIRTKLAHCTVITIAHRLDTIIDVDAVAVLDQGQVVQYGHPARLLGVAGSSAGALPVPSQFADMVQALGPARAAELRATAAAAWTNSAEHIRDDVSEHEVGIGEVEPSTA